MSIHPDTTTRSQCFLEVIKNNAIVLSLRIPEYHPHQLRHTSDALESCAINPQDILENFRNQRKLDDNEITDQLYAIPVVIGRVPPDESRQDDKPYHNNAYYYVPFLHQSVSRVHCMIICTRSSDGSLEWWIKDMKSTHGTFISSMNANKQFRLSSLQWTKLKHDQLIKVGQSTRTINLHIDGHIIANEKNKKASSAKETEEFHNFKHELDEEDEYFDRTTPRKRKKRDGDLDLENEQEQTHTFGSLTQKKEFIEKEIKNLEMSLNGQDASSKRGEVCVTAEDDPLDAFMNELDGRIAAEEKLSREHKLEKLKQELSDVTEVLKIFSK